ncbi:MAG TPA: LysR family transcriptional regulator [Eoetvoesiella sp.]
MNVSIRQLTYLREIVRARSFTEAANRLHTSQSNLSTAIRELEEAVGARLINRTTKRFELTDVGLSFLTSAERILDDLQAAIDDTSAVTRLEKGTLSIGAPSVHASTFLADMLGRFRQRHPALDMRLQEAPTGELPNLLRSRNIELALGDFQPGTKDIVAKPLFTERLVVLAHRTLTTTSPCSWQKFLELPVVSIAQSSSVGQLIQETVCRQIKAEYKPIIEAASWMSVVALTQTLRGACIVPYQVAERVKSLVLSGELVQLELQRPTVGRTIFVAHLASHTLTPTARAFLALLTSTFPPI